MTGGHTISWRELWAETEDRWKAQPGDGRSPQETRWLIAEASGFDDVEMILRIDEAVTERSMARFDDMVRRRFDGEPLQYVLGRWPFRRLDLLVDRRALIPRPETETLVDVALVALDRISGGRPCRVVDLGTGTGAIGLSIALERPKSQVALVERSPAAADLARANLAGTGRIATRVDLRIGDWFDALDASWAGTIDVVVSNPPYVAVGEVLTASVSEWEPLSALRSGVDGLDDLRRIIAAAPHWVGPDGCLVLEHGAAHQHAVIELCRAAGFQVEPRLDAAGRERFVVASR